MTLAIIDPTREFIQSFMTTQLFVSIHVLLIVVHLILGAVAYCTYGERKVSADIQDRIGPNRVGPYQRPDDVIHHPTPADLDRLRDPRAYRDEAFGRAMMDRIRVEEVMRATMERLAEQPPGSGAPGSGDDQPLADSNDRMNSANASQPDLGKAL